MKKWMSLAIGFSAFGIGIAIYPKELTSGGFLVSLVLSVACIISGSISIAKTIKDFK